MKKAIFICFISLISFSQNKTFAQSVDIYRDSVIQLYGVIMTADSLKAIPFASVIVEKKGRGTITNNDGVFSIAVNKGESITFSCVGFKNRTILIPTKLEGNQYSVIQLMVNDTNFLPATILKPRPSRAQFERDFVNAKVDDDMYETARKNTSMNQKRIILSSLPYDGKEAVGASLTQQASKYYYNGQLPPMNILNPSAWRSFINSWKRGDYKSKNNFMENIAVIGAGTMGNGIAHIFAQKGFKVHLIDTQSAALEKALHTIEKNLDRQVAKQTISAEEKNKALTLIQTFTSIEQGVLEADLVIEAATENSDIKKDILKCR